MDASIASEPTVDAANGSSSGGQVAYYVTDQTKATALQNLKVSDTDNTALFNVTPAGTNHWNVELNGTPSAETIAARLKTLVDATDSAFIQAGDNVTTGKDSTTAVITVQEPGYYLVTSSLGSKLVVQTLGNVTINEKNDKPSVEKTQSMSENGTYTGSDTILTGSIGDTVYYHVNIDIPASANSSITVNDTVSEGLTLNAEDNGITYSATSKVKSTGVSTAISGVSFESEPKKWSLVEGSSNSYSVQISADTVKALADKVTDGIKVTLTLSYSAKINSNAVIAGDGNTNTASIEYSHYTSEKSTVTVKTYEFDIVKTETGDDGKGILNGAQFELYKSSDVTEGTVKSDAKPIKFVKNDRPTLANEETNKALSAIYKVVEDQTTDLSTDANETRTTTLDAESIRVSGLANGTYYLKEITAPDGYNKLTSLKSININDSNALATTEAGSKYQNESRESSDTVKTYTSGGVRVENGKGSVLPSTGGIGTTIFYVAGIVLVIGAAALLITKKKRNA